MNDGRVKWFNEAKGYGFIRPVPEDKSVPDAMVHHSVIKMPGFRTLEEGQPVKYESEQGERGLVATAVWPLDGHRG